MKTTLVAMAALAIGSLAAAPAFAQAPAASEPAPPPPAPYSLPWQLRPAVPVNVVRNDLTLGFYKAPDPTDPKKSNAGFAAVESLMVAVKLESWVALTARVTAVGNAAPSPATGSGSVGNPVFGAMFSFKAADFRITPSISVALPLGMGGGDSPDPGPDAANKAAVRVRSSMDNSVFGPNYCTIIAGLDFAFIRAGFTAQAEVTLFESIRARGAAVSPDAAFTNLTMGLHLGYFFIPQLSLGAEIRHQRFLTTPAPVAADQALPADQQLGLRDTTTFAVGPRVHFKLGETTWIRPGVAYARGIDNPLSKTGYNIVQIDVPVVF